MKICHFADSHLGAGANHPRRGETGLTLRQEDIINAFIEAVDKIIEIKPDLCIHAGDLFDSARPLNKVMAIAGEQLHKLAETNSIPTIIITGNHDAPSQPFKGAALDVYRQIDNLVVVSNGALATHKFGDVCIQAVPHCLTNEKFQEELQKSIPDKNSRYNIIVTHGVAAGMPEFAMAELGELEIPLDVLKRFDYAALGHFHNYSQVAPRAFYCGSTERMSQSERAYAKGFIELELDPFKVKFHEVKTREMVDVQTINATGKRGDQLAVILQNKIESIGSTDKIVRIRVEGVTEETLKTMPSEILTRLKEESFSLNINFQKAEGDKSGDPFGKTSIGKIDQSFIEFLDVVDLKGFDRERLKTEAMKYLSEEE
ncbi:MAG: exonuclease SbcCD subunit D [bacterium]